VLQAQLLELRSQSISDENQSLKRAKELQKMLELSQHQQQETVAGETLKAECLERQLTQVIGCWPFPDSCSERQSVSYMSAACQHIVNTQSIYNRYTIGTHSQRAQYHTVSTHSITLSARTAIHSQQQHINTQSAAAHQYTVSAGCGRCVKRAICMWRGPWLPRCSRSNKPLQTPRCVSSDTSSRWRS
jgi:hypothetical protein